MCVCVLASICRTNILSFVGLRTWHSTHTAVSESISMDINGNTTASIVLKDTVRLAPYTIEEWMRLFSNKFNGIHYTAQKHRALSKSMQPNATNACFSYAMNDDYTQRMN